MQVLRIPDNEVVHFLNGEHKCFLSIFQHEEEADNDGSCLNKLWVWTRKMRDALERNFSLAHSERPHYIVREDMVSQWCPNKDRDYGEIQTTGELETYILVQKIDVDKGKGYIRCAFIRLDKGWVLRNADQYETLDF